MKLFIRATDSEKLLLERALFGGGRSAFMLSSEDWLLISLRPSGVEGSAFLFPLVAGALLKGGDPGCVGC